ncbi:MAG TPA: radical SAM protein [bacterium (Candidatus Stahlbacteria)]|nr:radical SAM protein [Candidatus Stahlbacteria bacterium]
MRIVGRAGREDLALVYLAATGDGRYVEFVESLQPPLARVEKWVLIISSLFGCPIRCRICDCGGDYKGRLTKEEILTQIDYLVTRRFPDREVPVKKFKIQFARVGEPSFNDAVLDILDLLPDLYEAPGLIPCLSTIAPEGRERFFDRLKGLKKRRYPDRFQLQFSIHSTDERIRDWLIPTRKWDFKRIASYGEGFYDKGGRKVTLNFALADGIEIDPDLLLRFFDPDIFFIKITPVNPTVVAVKNHLRSDNRRLEETVEAVQTAGFEVLLSIGELEENRIGSNCGQYIRRYKLENRRIPAYNYDLEPFAEKMLRLDFPRC